MEIWAKSVESFAKPLKNWAKMVPNVVWFENNGAQSVQNHMKTFLLEVMPKEGLSEKMFAQKVAQNFLGKFGEIRAKIHRTH